MAKSKKKQKKSSTKPEAQDTTATDLLAHDLEDLLRTVRRIAHHEDELCILAHAARTGEDSELLQDVSKLLKTMAKSNYNDEISTLIDTLSTLKPKKQKPNKSKSKKKR